MKNLKCLFGHNQRLMKLSDVTQSTYENDKEVIKTYKCKHCGMIIGGKTASVKFKLNDPDSEENKNVKNTHDVRIRKYENWSICNTNNCLSISSLDKPNGVIYFISEDEISEVEIAGMIFLTKQKFSNYEGLDIDCRIYKAKYRQNSNTIKPLYPIKGIVTLNASNYIHQYNQVKLDENTYILAIEYKYDTRYDKSKWWNFINRRKCNISYYEEDN